MKFVRSMKNVKNIPLIFSNENKPSNLNFKKIKNLDFSIYNNIIKIKLTNNCIFSCNYCYFHYKDNFISMKTILALLKEIEILKFKNVLFVLYGGEPTLHPKFYEIVKVLGKFGDVMVLSNIGKNIDFNIPCTWMFTLHTKYLNNMHVRANLRKIRTLPKEKYDLVLLMSKDNFKQVKNLYTLFKPVYNTSVGFVFQDIKYIPDEYLKLYNDSVIEVTDLKNTKQLYSYQRMILENFINFHGCKCSTGTNFLILDSDGQVYRCEAEFLNKNAMCTVDNLHSKIYNDSKPCKSYWCTEYWGTIQNEQC